MNTKIVITPENLAGYKEEIKILEGETRASHSLRISKDPSLLQIFEAVKAYNNAPLEIPDFLRNQKNLREEKQNVTNDLKIKPFDPNKHKPSGKDLAGNQGVE